MLKLQLNTLAATFALGNERPGHLDPLQGTGTKPWLLHLTPTDDSSAMITMPQTESAETLSQEVDIGLGIVKAELDLIGADLVNRVTALVAKQLQLHAMKDKLENTLLPLCREKDELKKALKEGILSEEERGKTDDKLENTLASMMKSQEEITRREINVRQLNRKIYEIENREKRATNPPSIAQLEQLKKLYETELASIKEKHFGFGASPSIQQAHIEVKQRKIHQLELDIQALAKENVKNQKNTAFLAPETKEVQDASVEHSKSSKISAFARTFQQNNRRLVDAMCALLILLVLFGALNLFLYFSYGGKGLGQLYHSSYVIMTGRAEGLGQ